MCARVRARARAEKERVKFTRRRSGWRSETISRLQRVAPADKGSLIGDESSGLVPHLFRLRLITGLGCASFQVHFTLLWLSLFSHAESSRLLHFLHSNYLPEFIRCCIPKSLQASICLVGRFPNIFPSLQCLGKLLLKLETRQEAAVLGVKRGDGAGSQTRWIREEG